jgi:hypothetical protein
LCLPNNPALAHVLIACCVCPSLTAAAYPLNHDDAHEGHEQDKEKCIDNFTHVSPRCNGSKLGGESQRKTQRSRLPSL